MCQLLALNSNSPNDICFSFKGLCARGGRTDHHQDGWGIAFFEGRGVRTIIDPEASAHSQFADFIAHYPIKSQNIIAHIRKATTGVVALENTHPFVRELNGRYWAFAHNGTLKDFIPHLSGRFLPVGTTDSERAFCLILDRLAALPAFADEKEECQAIFQVVHQICLELGSLGDFNFLLSSGRKIIAHCSTRLSYVLRKAPFQTIHLVDEDLSVDLGAQTKPTDRIAMIATTPLTRNEPWVTMTPGTLALFQDGDLVQAQTTVAGFKPDLGSVCPVVRQVRSMTTA